MIVPTHNRSDMLARTLRTVLWQRNVDIEIIVVDDGSTDDTAKLLRSMEGGRLRVVRHERPHGVSNARNGGISEADGEWIAFLDDDDVWAPNKLARQLQAAGESGSSWVYVGAVKIDEHERIVGGTPPAPPNQVAARLPTWNLIPGGCSGVMVAREELTSTGGFDPQLVNLADWDLWIRLGARGDPAYVPEALVGYRLHRGQASLDVDLILREVDLIDRRYGTPVDRGAIHHYLAHKCLLAGQRWRAANQFIKAGARGEMRQVFTDVFALLQAKIGLRLSGRGRQRPDPNEEWRAAAERWIGELQDPSGASPSRC